MCRTDALHCQLQVQAVKLNQLLNHLDQHDRKQLHYFTVPGPEMAAVKLVCQVAAVPGSTQHGSNISTTQEFSCSLIIVIIIRVCFPRQQPSTTTFKKTHVCILQPCTGMSEEILDCCHSIIPHSVRLFVWCMFMDVTYCQLDDWKNFVVIVVLF